MFKYTEKIYWSVESIDGKSGAIIKRNYNDYDLEIIIESKTLKNLCGLAVDIISSKNIFMLFI